MRMLFPRYFKRLDRLDEIIKNVEAQYPDAGTPRIEKDDNRGQRIWPYHELTIKQIEGMFMYNQSMDYDTTHGVIHMIPDPDHVSSKSAEYNRRKTETVFRTPVLKMPKK